MTTAITAVRPPLLASTSSMIVADDNHQWTMARLPSFQTRFGDAKGQIIDVIDGDTSTIRFHNTLTGLVVNRDKLQTQLTATSAPMMAYREFWSVVLEQCTDGPTPSIQCPPPSQLLPLPRFLIVHNRKMIVHKDDDLYWLDENNSRTQIGIMSAIHCRAAYHWMMEILHLYAMQFTYCEIIAQLQQSVVKHLVSCLPVFTVRSANGEIKNMSVHDALALARASKAKLSLAATTTTTATMTTTSIVAAE